jgi:hypothetical protein
MGRHVTCCVAAACFQLALPATSFGMLYRRYAATAGVDGVGQSTWAQVKAAGVAEATRQPAYSSMECCNLKPGSDAVDFNNDCSRVDVMAVNYTAEALQQSPWR